MKNCNKNIFNLRKSRNKTLSRKKAYKNMYETALIVCEGEITELKYFQEFAIYKSIQNNITIKVTNKGSSPDKVLQSAMTFAKDTNYDRIFCVFDKDKHGTYQQTLNKIQRTTNPKITAITSVPCFEFWLLLHYIFTTAPYYSVADPAKEVINKLLEYDTSYSKTNNQTFKQYFSKTDYAIQNSKRVLDEANNNKTDDPSTKVHILVEFLIKLSNKINS